MDHEYVRTQSELENLCRRLVGAERIGFDTEFVSEDTYRPDLCLIQVATSDLLAVIDPKQLKSVEPFWQLLCSGDQQTIVHAGREELRFCLHAVGQKPSRLFDTQIAAGMIGLEYPAAYGKLLSKLLDRTLPKGETRTDWRRRPLSDRQIEYALQDVMYLDPLFQRMNEQLVRLNRVSWFEDEMNSWQSEIEQAELRENWRRVSGTSGLSEKAMVIVRELWRWREEQAERTNRPPKRILRDDLIVELARRAKSDVKQIRAIRGIERSVASKNFSEIAGRIRKALDLPRSQWPAPRKKRSTNHGSLCGQFVATALNSICRSQNLAPSLVGTVQDVRDLVEYRLHPPAAGEAEEIPLLAQGWRAEVVGQTLDDVLTGKIAIRVRNPKSDNPLALEHIP